MRPVGGPLGLLEGRREHNWMRSGDTRKFPRGHVFPVILLVNCSLFAVSAVLAPVFQFIQTAPAPRQLHICILTVTLAPRIIHYAPLAALAAHNKIIPGWAWPHLSLFLFVLYYHTIPDVSLVESLGKTNPTCCASAQGLSPNRRFAASGRKPPLPRTEEI